MKMNYITPEVEIIEIEVEKGFATSPGNPGFEEGEGDFA